MAGHITRRLFETLNTRFYKSSGAHKFLSLIYGEISEDARFRFLSAGQPHPAVFSAEHDCFMDVSPVSFPPLAILPSLGVIDQSRTESPMGFAERYELNDWSLMGTGDTCLTPCTDGLTEHSRRRRNPYVLFASKIRSGASSMSPLARSTTPSCRTSSPSPSSDDLSLVVIKR